MTQLDGRRAQSTSRKGRLLLKERPWATSETLRDLSTVLMLYTLVGNDIMPLYDDV